ncbi:hypothetical protein ACFS07_11140 [Undibacterium arcticum]
MVDELPFLGSKKVAVTLRDPLQDGAEILKIVEAIFDELDHFEWRK